ncbi:WD40 repeat domain-containing protein [Streptosporangium sp. NBC_01639]|uniref:WD40 repeat domain-containing protein n=1 Tax=Streptosporangium sp. NBC_01639 TaxID=2975948 RepID=UPI00386BEC1D|nr:WD40 repeat domain-containing protein [Streptosporangium sp. NBC_01639]
MELGGDVDPQGMLVLLQDADWNAFVPERDLPPLRERLVALEQEHGTTEAHRFATARLQERGARLMQPYIGWDSPFNDYALSPCGRHLATGPDNGPLQIWEMTTGRAVNKLDTGEAGVGWAGHRDTVQWSADGTRLALAFNTNMVGLWDPFGEQVDPVGDADVTDGRDRPPAFALSPDGRRAYISMRSSHQVMGCIAALDRGHVFSTDSREDGSGPAPEMLPEALPEEFSRRIERDEWSFRRVRWSRDGTRLLGFNGEWACAVDVPGGRMRWLAHTEDVVEWSPDGRRFASIAVGSGTDGTGRLTVFESETGSAVGAPVEQLQGTLHWGMRGEAARLAVVAGDGRGVDVYDEDGRHESHLDIDTTEQIGVSYWGGGERPWAWSPSGEHGACLTSDDQIEVWSLGDDPACVRSIEVPEETAAVLWGADGVLAAIGGFTLRFVRALTGDVLGDFANGREDEEGLAPVEDGDGLHGIYTADVFPLDDTTWCALASPPEGLGANLVIAPAERRADLDGLLAWVVDRRFAWPVRWGDLNLVEDTEAAAAEFA